ncbi:MAG: UbiA family prenyltransferase [Candidatus Bathyarchaeota archaeon]|nr:UbiA family prenyltransferase [Candidatus Bathyarchaeota archaeon]
MRVHEYWKLLKPRVLLAMVALYAASYLASYAHQGGGTLDVFRFASGLAAVFTAVGGSNALNCYLDRDIDAVMARTMARPLPRGSVGLRGALALGLLLLASASALSLSQGILPFILFAEGAGSYLIFYTWILKRRTRLNVLATAPAVAAPAWFGWIMGGAPFNMQALVLGLIVAVWGPLHLWSIAYAFAGDYLRGGVPMLPAVASPGTAVKSVLAALLVLISSSYLLAPWARSPLYVFIVSLINIPLTLAGLRFYVDPSRRSGWWLFKLTAPYIVVVLFAFTADQYLLL